VLKVAKRQFRHPICWPARAATATLGAPPSGQAVLPWPFLLRGGKPYQADIRDFARRIVVGFTLDSHQVAQVREALLSTDSDRLIELVSCISLGWPPPESALLALPLTEELGWTKPGQPAFTDTGMLAADSIREYRLWLDRDRKLHGEDHSPLLRPESYAGLEVLEPGSGFGCNLLSLQATALRAVGIEPVAIYEQFTEILATREGLNPPEIIVADAESMPVGDASFDVVLCYSAHQYMDVRRAFVEFSRVLRPGGQLQLIGGTRDDRSPMRIGNFRQLRSDWLTTINTVAYERFGRRLLTPKGLSRTTAPVYPRLRYIDVWLKAAGLHTRQDLRRRIGTDTLTVAEKK